MGQSRRVGAAPRGDLDEQRRERYVGERGYRAAPHAVGCDDAQMDVEQRSPSAVREADRARLDAHFVGAFDAARVAIPAAKLFEEHARR